jgi:DNA invertase Pin-like site-specific DNA recombinase
MADTGKFVAYYRVSTKRQGDSGLGLEAQKDAVEVYLNGGDWELIAEYQEVETGKKNDRPELTEALRHCMITGAKLIIAKLDRLSRDAHFLLGLQKAGVPFVAADMPEANEMVVGMMAVIAQGERKMISARTKAALAVKKEQLKKMDKRLGNPEGTNRLGNPSGAKHLRRYGNGAAVVAVKAKAQQSAEDRRVVVEDIRASGVTSLEGIAKAMNERGILTARGKSWHPTSVKRLLDRLAA